MQQPTRIVSWAKESLPDQMRARIPPAVSTVERDERYAGAVVLFLLALTSWVLSSTVGLMPLVIVSVVIGVYYCIPALMKRRGLRISAPKPLEQLLTKVDTVICNKIPPQFRCARTLQTLRCGTLRTLYAHLSDTLPALVHMAAETGTGAAPLHRLDAERTDAVVFAVCLRAAGVAPAPPPTPTRAA